MLIAKKECNERFPRILTYSMALAKLFLENDGRNTKLWDAKLDALKKTWSLLEWYASEYFNEDLLDTIMEKKARRILDATSIKTIQELGNPPRPHYTGSKWVISENSIPEEELIWWSKTSLKGPLIDTAFNRYMELFRMICGDQIEEFMGHKEEYIE